MMRAMPYNLQGKGVVEVSGIISQISSAVPPKWKSLDKFHNHQQHQQQEDKATPATAISEEEEEEEARRTSSIDSEEPTSTLDTTRRSPSTPTSTSTSTLSSSLNNNNTNTNNSNNKENTVSEKAAAAAAGVANPGACVRKEGGWGSELHNLHQRSGDCDNVTATANNNNNTTTTATAAACIGVDRLVENSAALEDWDTMFPTGEGALLPWIIGDAEDPSLGLKHLLQSASHVVDYEGNAGLGVVDQAPPFDVHHHHPPPLGVSGNHNNTNDDGGSNSGFLGSEFGNNGKIGCLMDAAAKVSSNSNSNSNSNNGMNLGSNSMLLGSVAASFGQQYEFGDEKPQIYNPQLVMNPQQVAQTLGNPSFFMPPLGYCQLDPHLGGFQPPTKRHNPGVVLDPNLVVKNSFVDQGHELLLRKHQQHQQQQQHHQQVGVFQQLPMGLPPQLVPPHLQQQKPMLSTKQNHHQQQQQQQQHFPLPVVHHSQQQQQQQDQLIRDTLYKAADLIQTGNFSLAQEILARLNHPLSLSSKPLDRAALYVKEALQMLLMMGNPVAAPPPSSSSKNLTPFDVVHKMNAYKVFSEVSPFTQFINFTSTQAILEALDDSDALHIIDFDIGCGAQWASFIQELPLRKRGPPSLKITAFAPLSTTHPFEIGLVRDNLVQFASDTGVPFELQVVNLDSFDPSSCSIPNFRASEDEAVAVSIPVWSSSNRPSILPPILEFIKQRAPKIVVSLDRGFDRYDVPFPQHLVHTLDSCTSFLESLDGYVASDIGTKVEKFFVQPRIENTVLGRVHFPEKMPHWKNLFSSAGFSPVQFSNFTETQADYVVKRAPGRGFHVEKRQSSLVLSWQRRELVAASAWRC